MSDRPEAPISSPTADPERSEVLRETMGLVKMLVDDIETIDGFREGFVNGVPSLDPYDVLPSAKSVFDACRTDEVILDEDALFAGAILVFGDKLAELGQIDSLPSTEEVVRNG